MKSLDKVRTIWWHNGKYPIHENSSQPDTDNDAIICPYCHQAVSVQIVTHLIQYGFETDIQVVLLSCTACEAPFGLREQVSHPFGMLAIMDVPVLPNHVTAMGVYPINDDDEGENAWT